MEKMDSHLKYITQSNESIYCISALKDKKNIWYILKVDKVKLPLFKKNMEDKRAQDFLRYATILYFGQGKSPSDKIYEKIEKKYGVSFAE